MDEWHGFPVILLGEHLTGVKVFELSHTVRQYGQRCEYGPCCGTDDTVAYLLFGAKTQFSLTSSLHLIYLH